MSSPRKKASKDKAQPDHDELNDLILKLQALLPTSGSKRDRRDKVAASEIINETCNFIKKLQKEVENVGVRLSQLLDSMESKCLDDVDILRDLASTTISWKSLLLSLCSCLRPKELA